MLQGLELTPDLIKGIGIGGGFLTTGIGLLLKFIKPNGSNGLSAHLQGQLEEMLRDTQSTVRTVNQNQVEIAHSMSNVAKSLERMDLKAEEYYARGEKAMDKVDLIAKNLGL